jgi:hypothetical protein
MVSASSGLSVKETWVFFNPPSRISESTRFFAQPRLIRFNVLFSLIIRAGIYRYIGEKVDG